MNIQGKIATGKRPFFWAQFHLWIAGRQSDFEKQPLAQLRA